MAYSLLREPKHKYSQRERRLFAALPKTGREVTSDVLAEKVYPDPANRPFFMRQSLIGVANSLSRKMEANGEPYRLHKGDRRGPWPCQFWLTIM